MNSDSKNKSLKVKTDPKKNISIFKRFDKRNLILLSLLAGMFVLGTSVAAYTNYVVNSPENVWNKAVENTEVYSSRIKTSVDENKTPGGEFKGQIAIESPTAISAAIEGSWYDNNVAAQSQINFSGFKVDSELISVYDSENDTSKTYVKFDGLNSVSLLLSLLQPEIAPYISEINNTWYEIDQLTEDQLMPDQKTDLSLPNNTGFESVDSLLSTFKDNVQYLQKEYIGQEDRNDISTYKYKVTVDKNTIDSVFSDIVDNLNQYDATILENKETTDSIEKYKEQLKSLGSETFNLEVWIDKEYKYFTNMRIDLSQFDSESKGLIELGLNYKGGDEYPFYINVNLNSLSIQENINLALGVQYNVSNGYINLNTKVDAENDGQTIKASAVLLLVPSDELVDVEAPDNSKDIQELQNILNSLNLDSLSQISDGVFPSEYLLDDVELR
jgi:hypothetical protein